MDANLSSSQVKNAWELYLHFPICFPDMFNEAQEQFCIFILPLAPHRNLLTSYSVFHMAY
jgi:hypothetical protein